VTVVTASILSESDYSWCLIIAVWNSRLAADAKGIAALQFKLVSARMGVGYSEGGNGILYCSQRNFRQTFELHPTAVND